MGNDVKDVAQDMQDRMRELAYLMWESAGRQQGMAMEYWLAAEREVLATTEAATRTMMPSPTKKTEAKAAAPENTVPAKKTKAPEAAGKKTAYKIEQIKGIGAADAAKLASAGIETTDDLLDRCGGAEERETIAGKAGVTAKLLLKWGNLAEFMRISRVGSEYAELLEAAGVDGIKGLRTRNAEDLAAKMAEINARKKLTRRLASAKQVAKWVDQAKTLEPKITH